MFMCKVRGEWYVNFVGPQKPLLSTVKRRKLQWYGHVTRDNNLAKTILQGTVGGGDTVGVSGKPGKTTSKSGHPSTCRKG